jgi:uncharacterized damage-inducible protein DinB
MATPSSTDSPSTIYMDLEHELDTTRRMLERFPSGHNDWRPHPKSMTLSRLASHVAELPGFGTKIITTDEMDFAKGEYVSKSCGSADELLATFDETAGALRTALAASDSGALSGSWTLRNGETVLISQPKAVLVRGMMINHLVHHRAQLGVYYRMLDVPIPGSYGPSADEPM